MDRVIPSGSLGSVMLSTLAHNARAVGSNPAVGAIYSIFVIPHPPPHDNYMSATQKPTRNPTKIKKRSCLFLLCTELLLVFSLCMFKLLPFLKLYMFKLLPFLRLYMFKLLLVTVTCVGSNCCFFLVCIYSNCSADSRSNSLCNVRWP